jgi:hypothetical protein
VLCVTEIAQRDVFRMPPAPALPTAAVDRLPRGELGVTELDEDPFWRLVAAFLVECRRAQTRRAYFTDLKAWYAWCAARDLHPLQARRHDVALWARHLAEQPQASGKPAAPASIARRLSCLSSFYGYGVEVGVLDDNPVTNVKRPRVATASMTVGLARDELEQLLDAAEADGPRSAALVTLLAYNGLRVDEALSRDVEHLGHQQGHRVLRISRKGGRDALEPLSPPVERALDTHLADRTTGPLLPTTTTAACTKPKPGDSSAASPATPASNPPANSAPTACATRSRPASATPASHSKTSKTPWVTPTPVPPAATWPPTNTSTGTRRTPSPPGSAATPATQRPSRTARRPP